MLAKPYCADAIVFDVETKTASTVLKNYQRPFICLNRCEMIKYGSVASVIADFQKVNHVVCFEQKINKLTTLDSFV